MQVQPEVQLNLNLTIVAEIIAKGTVKHIKQPKSTVSYYCKKLKAKGIIERIGKAWQVSAAYKGMPAREIIHKAGLSSTSSAGLRSPKEANLHALSILIPIVSGKADLKYMGGFERQVKNWVAQYLKLSTLQLTLQNNNNRSITVNAWSRNVYDPLAIPSLCHKYVHAVCSMFKEHGVVLDYFGWQVKTMHIQLSNDDISKVLNKGLKVEVLLGRQAGKVTERDADKDAKAWVDSSPTAGIETNDIDYYRNYVLMPENAAKTAALMQKYIDEVIPIQKEHAENIKTHTKVLKDISKSFAKFNKLLGRMQQTRLGMFK